MAPVTAESVAAAAITRARFSTFASLLLPAAAPAAAVTAATAAAAAAEAAVTKAGTAAATAAAAAEAVGPLLAALPLTVSTRYGVNRSHISRDI